MHMLAGYMRIQYWYRVPFDRKLCCYEFATGWSGTRKLLLFEIVKEYDE
jgi:hypothetical protein